MLDAKLVSPLGGEYELRESPGGLKTWVSTALADRSDSTQPPATYQFPALNWLRGIKLELRAHDGLLAVHAEVIMPVETQRGGRIAGLPSFGPKPTESRRVRSRNTASPVAVETGAAKPRRGRNLLR